MNEIEFINILDTNIEIQDKIRLWRNQNDIRNYMINNKLISHEEHRNWLNSLSKRNDYILWVVYYKKVPFGTCYLHDIDYNNNNTYWGFYIAEKEFRGKKLGKVILYMLIEKVFNELNFHKLSTSVLSNNSIALQLYEKFGFKNEGILREQVLHDEIYYDLFLFGLFKNEWNKIKDEILNSINKFKII